MAQFTVTEKYKGTHTLITTLFLANSGVDSCQHLHPNCFSVQHVCNFYNSTNSLKNLNVDAVVEPLLDLEIEAHPPILAQLSLST